MNRTAQGMVTILLGAVALSTTVGSDAYLNYVRAGFRPFLVAAGAALVVLGAAAVAAQLRAAVRGEPDTAAPGHGHAHEHGHDHSRGPAVAWLLLLPVAVVFVVAPPALGAYTATTASTASAAEEVEPPDDGLGDPDDGPVEMEVQEFVVRAWTDTERTMAGRDIRLTGFAVPNPEGEGWYLARLQMACCAADAIVNRVLVVNRPEPPADSWWTVTGRWVEPEGEVQDVRDHRFEVDTMAGVDNPPDPYE